MLQKITDLWPNLLRQYQGLEIEEDGDDNNADDIVPIIDEDIELSFKNMRWTWVITLREYKE